MIFIVQSLVLKIRSIVTIPLWFSLADESIS